MATTATGTCSSACSTASWNVPTRCLTLFPKTPAWRELFRLRGETHHALFTRHLSVVLVELPKLPPQHAKAPCTPGEQWAHFLKEPADMERMIREPWVTPELQRAREELQRLAGDPAARRAYELRQREVSTLATYLRDSYLNGVEEGRRKAAATLLKLIQLKFGAPDPATMTQVEAAPEATLEAWTERILHAQTLAELLAPPPT